MANFFALFNQFIVTEIFMNQTKLVSYTNLNTLFCLVIRAVTLHE